MEILLLLVAGLTNIACFAIGAKVGQQAAKGEPVKISIPDPLQKIRETASRREADREKTKLEAILGNLERYDGTPEGQEEVPQ